MNAVASSVLSARLTSPYARTIVVSPWGFPMECEYEHDPGEPAIFWPTERAHPGSPPCASLLACRVGGVDIINMLSPRQVDRLEQAILEALQ